MVNAAASTRALVAGIISSDRPDKHAPARFRSYLRAHDNNMEDLRRGGFVGDDTLSFDARAGGELVLAGEIACLGHIVVDVFKVLEVLEGAGADAMVQTLFYSYNVFVRGGNNIIRYDNLHPRKDHPGRSPQAHLRLDNWGAATR